MRVKCLHWSSVCVPEETLCTFLLPKAHIKPALDNPRRGFQFCITVQGLRRLHGLDFLTPYAGYLLICVDLLKKAVSFPNV